jgi:hypothetical protein
MVGLNMTVKLPSTSSLSDEVDVVAAAGGSGGADGNRGTAVAVNTKPCRFSGCDFYGTPELHYFCSKCYSKLHPSSNKVTQHRSM